jgi:hypothetical protein
VKIPDREAARSITWVTEMLLSYGDQALPTGLKVALREYKSALLIACASEKWASTGQATRYGRLADLIGQQIAQGEFEAGQRMPSDSHLAEIYEMQPDTVRNALHVLAVRGQLALEGGSYYVLPAGMV